MSARFMNPSPLIRWGPVVIIMVVIFGFSSVPSDDMPHFGEMDFIVKKLGHMAGYALLSLAFAWGIGIQKPGVIWKAWLLTVAYAVTDEFHQSFVPGRNASLMDVVIDALGASIGLIPVVVFRKLSSLPVKRPE
jgi:VanZ family protein